MNQIPAESCVECANPQGEHPHSGRFCDEHWPKHEAAIKEGLRQRAEGKRLPLSQVVKELKAMPTNPTAVAGATTECQDCSGTGVYHAKDFANDGPESIGTNSFCSACAGKGPAPGRIYALPDPDTVRVVCIPCQGRGKDAWCWLEGRYQVKEPGICTHCRGLGFTASDRLEVWLCPTKRLFYRIDVYDDGSGICEVYTGTPWATAPADGEDFLTPPESASFENRQILPALHNALAAALVASGATLEVK